MNGITINFKINNLPPNLKNKIKLYLKKTINEILIGL